MKKLGLVAMLIFTGFAFAQEAEKTVDFKRNELKGNALLLILGSFEFSYERILNEESGIGVSINIPFEKDNFDINYTFTGYYRYYFGKKPAAGFFGEAFGMLNSIDDYLYNDSPDYYYEQKTLTDFALGIGLGGKWISKKGVLFEINTGVGRNLFNNQYDDRDYELIGRAGITIGYRF